MSQVGTHMPVPISRRGRLCEEASSRNEKGGAGRAFFMRVMMSYSQPVPSRHGVHCPHLCTRHSPEVRH